MKYTRASLITASLVISILLNPIQNAFCEPQLTIGLMSELTGPGAPNGKACLEGYRVAESFYASDDSISGKVRLIFADHRGESLTALSEFERMVEVHGASAVISNRGHIGMALDPASRKRQIPLLGIMGHAQFVEQNPYGFRFWVPIASDGRFLAQLVHKRGFKRAAMVVLHDDYILSLANVFQESFQELGGTVAYFETIEKSFTDFSTVITRIKSSQPDVIFVNGTVAQLGLLVRKIREQGLEQQLISNFWIGYDDVIKSAGSTAIEGSLYISLDLERPVFLNKLRGLYPKSEPSAVTYACYAALATIYELVKSHPDLHTKEELYRALRERREIPLHDGSVKMIGREVYFGLVPYEIQSGRTLLARDLMKSLNKM